MNDFQNVIFNAFGGRKYFYCSIWCTVATILVWHGKISSPEWVVILMWFFSNVIIADNREAVANIKAEAVKSDSSN